MAKKSQGAKAPEHEVVRANLRLDAEQYRRLLVFSVMESRSAGDIVSSLLEQHLRGWSMPGKVAARVNSRHFTTSVIHDDPVNLEAEIAA
jgi:hypothetical protein